MERKLARIERDGHTLVERTPITLCTEDAPEAPQWWQGVLNTRSAPPGLHAGERYTLVLEDGRSSEFLVDDVIPGATEPGTSDFVVLGTQPL